MPYERWLHITDPAGRHRYMIQLRAEVELTLQDPEVIVRSAQDRATVRIYHKWFEHTVVGSKWVRVAVKFLDAGDAFVLTAYTERGIMPGEVLWRKER